MNDSQQLAALMARKAQLLDMLKRLGEAQLALVTASDMTRLLQVLSSKESLLTQLQQVERQLDPFRGQDPELRHWESAAARQACQANADCCAALLNEIVALEKQSEAEMTVRRDATAAQLQGLYVSQEAQGAYTTGPTSLVASFDLSMEG
jgi:hypothetical protein